MTADDAGRNWLNRVSEIQAEYADRSYSRAAVHGEASTAAQGISALLENRWTELTPQMVEWLQAAVDVCARVNADTLEDSYVSPWREGADEFGSEVSREVRAGVTGVKTAASDLVKKLEFDFTVIAVAVIVVLVLVSVIERKVAGSV